MPPATSGDRLRWFREDVRRQSARAVARAVTGAGFPCSHSQLLRYERGAVFPPALVVALKDAYGLSTEWLLTGSGHYLAEAPRRAVWAGVGGIGAILQFLGEAFQEMSDRARAMEPEPEEWTFEYGSATVIVRHQGYEPTHDPTRNPRE